MKQVWSEVASCAWTDLTRYFWKPEILFSCVRASMHVIELSTASDCVFVVVFCLVGMAARVSPDDGYCSSRDYHAPSVSSLAKRASLNSHHSVLLGLTRIFSTCLGRWGVGESLCVCVGGLVREEWCSSNVNPATTVNMFAMPNLAQEQQSQRITMTQKGGNVYNRLRFSLPLLRWFTIQKLSVLRF